MGSQKPSNITPFWSVSIIKGDSGAAREGSAPTQRTQQRLGCSEHLLGVGSTSITSFHLHSRWVYFPIYHIGKWSSGGLRRDSYSVKVTELVASDGAALKGTLGQVSTPGLSSRLCPSLPWLASPSSGPWPPEATWEPGPLSLACGTRAVVGGKRKGSRVPAAHLRLEQERDKGPI